MPDQTKSGPKSSYNPFDSETSLIQMRGNPLVLLVDEEKAVLEHTETKIEVFCY